MEIRKFGTKEKVVFHQGKRKFKWMDHTNIVKMFRCEWKERYELYKSQEENIVILLSLA